MKQFNLEEYLKNPSRKVITRDGRKVKIHCTNSIGSHPVMAQIEGERYSYSYNKNGECFCKPSASDLFFATEKHEGWLNIYRSDECGFYMRGDSPYKSKEEADKVAKANPKTFFTTIKIEWEE